MQEANFENLMAMTFDDITTFEQFRDKFNLINHNILKEESELVERQKELWKLMKEDHELSLKEMEYKAAKEKEDSRKNSDILAIEELKQLEDLHAEHLKLMNLTNDCIDYDQDDIPFRIQIRSRESKHLVYRAYLDKERRALERFTLFNKKENSERPLTKVETKDLLLEVLRVNFKSAEEQNNPAQSDEFKFMTMLFFPIFRLYDESI